MRISGNMKMADVMHLDIQLLAVIQRLNIPLGFREKTVKEVCEEQEVDLSFFLEIANSFFDPSKFVEEKFMDFPVEWIINYLKKAHECYLEHRIPEIDKQINSLEKKAPSNSNISLLLNFFREYVNEFTSHILLEEDDVFPHILNLNNYLNNPQTFPHTEHPFGEYSIESFHTAHNNIEEKLFDLKNILLKYLPPPSNDCQYNHLLFDIFRLDNDLKDHADLEEKVLFPRVRMMEAQIKKLGSSKQ